MTTNGFKVGSISVIGLGKLGTPLVACCASKGFSVIGVDSNPDAVRLVDAALPPVAEPGLKDLLSTGRDRISATHDYRRAILNSDITFLVVPTPSEPSGRFSARYIVEAAPHIGAALSAKENYHLIVVVSTVLPGTTDNEIRPLLESASGKRCGVDFGLCYGPEFIALGSVIRDMLNPDFVLIGESDPFAGNVLESFYRAFCDNQPPISRMTIVNAELAKISVNSFVTMKISFANNLSEICEKVPGADVDVVTSALGLDSRIGRKYMKGALGYGGPCFPRDNAAFSYMAQEVGADPTIAEATDTVNRRQSHRLLQLVTSYLPPGGRAGVLGLSYKPDTEVIEASQAFELAWMLVERGVPTIVYDPSAMQRAKGLLGKRAVYACSMDDCVRDADVVVVATPWPQFREISPELLARKPYRRVLIDCWRLLQPARLGDSVQYITIGNASGVPYRGVSSRPMGQHLGDNIQPLQIRLNNR